MTHDGWIVGISAIAAMLWAIAPEIRLIYRAFFGRDPEHYEIDE